MRQWGPRAENIQIQGLNSGWNWSKDGTAAADFTLPCDSGPWGLCGESGESGAWSTVGLTGSSKISGVLALAPVFKTRNIVSNNNNDVIITQ